MNDRFEQWAGLLGCGIGSSSPQLVYNIQDEVIEFKVLFSCKAIYVFQIE